VFCTRIKTTILSVLVLFGHSFLTLEPIYQMYIRIMSFFYTTDVGTNLSRKKRMRCTYITNCKTNLRRHSYYTFAAKPYSVARSGNKIEKSWTAWREMDAKLYPRDIESISRDGIVLVSLTLSIQYWFKRINTGKSYRKLT
jgi:hypothetical protein